jgi:hypothetical protein
MFNEYKCKICEKEYKSYQSLWNHNKIKHNTAVKDNVKDVKDTVKDVKDIVKTSKKHICEICNKEFTSRQSKYEHKKNVCKIKENNIINSNNKTINNNNQINNGTINNNNINIKVSLGNENIDDLSKKDQLKILNSGYMSLIKIIELLNLNPDLPQYNNILVTNLKDKFCKIYDDDTKKYKTVNKKDMVENMITVRTHNLKEIYNKYNNKNNKMHQLVLLLIDKLNSITIEDDELMKYYKDLCEEIILLIYNKTEIYEKNIIN